MEITSPFGRSSEVCYVNVEGQRLLCLMGGWITGHLQGIWLALWFIFGCCFLLYTKEESPCLWLLPPLHWTRRRSFFGRVYFLSSFPEEVQRWQNVEPSLFFPSDEESADSECSLYRQVVPWLACRMWLELQNHWRHEEADIDPTTEGQCRKHVYSALINTDCFKAASH